MFVTDNMVNIGVFQQRQYLSLFEFCRHRNGYSPQLDQRKKGNTEFNAVVKHDCHVISASYSYIMLQISGKQIHFAFEI